MILLEALKLFNDPSLTYPDLSKKIKTKMLDKNISHLTFSKLRYRKSEIKKIACDNELMIEVKLFKRIYCERLGCFVLF